MWKFQEDKRRRLENSEDISDRSPFYCEGLYSFSRHPNYFCEVGMWWTFYLFSITSNANHTLLHWTGIGALMLTLLIDGSLDLVNLFPPRSTRHIPNINPKLVASFLGFHVDCQLLKDTKQNEIDPKRIL